jgi:hypothetical protein
MPSRMPDGATLEGIRQQLTESLERLGCGHIDLYYMHRVCGRVPIDDVARAMKQLQVYPNRYRAITQMWPRACVFGRPCSDATSSAERGAHQAHRPERGDTVGAHTLPLHRACQRAAARVEHRHEGRRGCRSRRRCPCRQRRPNPPAVIPCARELGVGIVAYSPLCRGLLTGAVQPSQLPATDRRSANPRFTADNFSTNMAACAEPLAKIAGSMLLHGAAHARADAAARSDQRMQRGAAVARVGARAGRGRLPHSWNQIRLQTHGGKRKCSCRYQLCSLQQPQLTHPQHPNRTWPPPPSL